MRSMKSGVLYLALLVVLMLTVRPIGAHGGGVPFVSNEPLGEFTASVWLDPNPLEVGTVHVTVALAQGESVALNQEVRVMLSLADGSGATLENVATHENATNRFMYEADFEVTQAGMYEVRVSVPNQDGAVAFEAEIRGPSWTSSPWIGPIALLIVAAIWFLNRGGKR